MSAVTGEAKVTTMLSNPALLARATRLGLNEVQLDEQIAIQLNYLALLAMLAQAKSST